MMPTMRLLSLGVVLAIVPACDGGGGSGGGAGDSLSVCLSPDDTYVDPADAEVALINAMAIWNTALQTDESTDVIPPDQYDAQNIFTHELGHVLGIKHVEHADAIMSKYAPWRGVKERSLHDADVDAYLALEDPRLFVYAGIATDCDIEVRFAFLENPRHIGFRSRDRITLDPRHPLYFTQEEMT